MDKMAELASHTANRSVKVLAGDSAVVLGQCLEPHETVLEAKLGSDLGRGNEGRGDERLDYGCSFRLSNNRFNFCYIAFRGCNHHLLKIRLT